MATVAAPIIQEEMDDWVHLGGGNSGIVGDSRHRGGFHLSAEDVPADDYSRRRDPNGADGPYVDWLYACAGDFSHGNNELLRVMHRNVLSRLMRGELRMICQFIGKPWVDRPVYYWARWNGTKNIQRYTGSGHDHWSHISWYRSRVDQRANLWVPPSAMPKPPAAPKRDWTEDLIMSLPTLRKGSKGEYVKRSQALLAAAGFPPANSFRRDHTPDGVAGTGWDTAVRKFQKSERIKVDGIQGKDTWTKILKG